MVSRLITFVAICLSGIWFAASAQSPSGAASPNIVIWRSRLIAFGSQVDSRWELWVMDSNGTRERHLYSQIVAKSARGWSRDGKRIVFAAVAVADENIDLHTSMWSQPR